MLTAREFAVLFIVTLIPFSLYLTTDTIAGNDGYAFLNVVCHGFYIPSQADLVYPLFSLLPCNILALKLILFGLAFASVCFLALTGKLIYKEKGYLAGVLFWLSPILLAEFVKFENDQFAYPLIFLAVYFFVKFFTIEEKESKYLFSVLALTSLWVAGFIWQGAIYMLLAFGLYGGLYTLVAGSALILLWSGILANALPAMGIYESTPLLGVSLLGLLLIGVVGVWKPIKEKVNLRRATLFMVGLATLTAKFTIMAVPFLSLGLLEFWLDPRAERIKGILTAILVVFLVFFASVPLTYPPHKHHFEAINFAINASDDNTISNDWSYGYWVLWLGGETKSMGHFSKQGDYTGISVTVKELDCELLKEFEEVKVYECPG